MRLALEMCELQFKGKRDFVVEQPLNSRAWLLEPVTKLMSTKGVISTEFHQCMYGLIAVDRIGPAPALKPTRVLTSSPALAETLTRRCDGSHRHAQPIGKSACSRAAQYPHGLCKAILKATDIIKKARSEANSFVAEDSVGAGGQALAMGATHWD